MSEQWDAPPAMQDDVDELKKVKMTTSKGVIELELSLSTPPRR